MKVFLRFHVKRKFMRCPMMKLKYLYKKGLPLNLLKNMEVVSKKECKDKGKAIMKEPSTPKKVKKRTQVKLSMDEELARKMEEEKRIRFNAEREARALQEEEEERLNLEAARELKRQLN
ncbi:hypothetical protein Tco_0127444 [Tanacetum coccineum]